MKVIVAGSRTITDYEVVKRILLNHLDEISMLISGCAKGVDTHGLLFAHEYNIPTTKDKFKITKEEWRKYGKQARHLRNLKMGKEGEKLIAIHEKGSRGTQDMINIMRDFGKPVVHYKL